jgi:type I restriction enzyme S subunit
VNNWKETTLGEVAEIVMGQSPKGESYNLERDGIPFYQGITEFDEKYVKVKTYTTEPTKIVRPNTVLFSVRAPVGKVNFTRHEACIGRGNAGLVMKNGEQEFLYYLLKCNERAIQNNTSGTVFESISGSELRKYAVIIPSNKSEQKAIAAILSSLDDKIELLKRQNKTLASIAQVIFKEWFVKFNIKNQKLKIKKETGLPDGWMYKGLDEIADFLNGLALQNYPPENEADVLPVIKIRELKAGITEQTDKASKQIDAKYIIENGDVLFSWSGSLDVVLWCYGKGSLNQHLFKVTSKKYPKWFYYYWILEHLQFFRSIAEAKATTMGHIQRHHLAEALVAVPDGDFMAFADSTIKPVFEHIVLNNSQIQTLSKLRDALLPKLMKGEIRVKL